MISLNVSAQDGMNTNRLLFWLQCRSILEWLSTSLKIEKSKIYKNFDILDEREKEVFVGRFGLEHGGEERTQREIAKEPGISRSYVSRIEKRALMKLYYEFYKVKKWG